MSTSSLDFYSSLLRLFLTSKQQLMDNAKKYDLTFIQAVTILISSETEPQPMKAFQEVYHCDASNVTGIIDGLEERQLVSRDELPTDRRVKTILLSPAGQETKEQLASDFVRMADEVLSPLSDEERTQFEAIVRKLTVE